MHYGRCHVVLQTGEIQPVANPTRRAKSFDAGADNSKRRLTAIAALQNIGPWRGCSLLTSRFRRTCSRKTFDRRRHPGRQPFVEAVLWRQGSNGEESSSKSSTPPTLNSSRR